MTWPADSPVVEYSPGPWVAFSGSRLCVLADIPLSSPLVPVLHAAITQGGTVDSVLEVIAAEGLRSVVSFAVAEVVGGQFRVIVRGAAVVEVSTMGTADPVSVTSAGLWADRTLPGDKAVLRAPGEPVGRVLPLSGGVVPAGSVQVSRAGAFDAASTGSVTSPDQPAGEAAPMVALPGDQPAPAPQPAPVRPNDPGPVAATPSAVVDRADPFTSAGSSAATYPGPDPADDDSFDDLFKSTLLQRPVLPSSYQAPSAPAAPPAPGPFGGPTSGTTQGGGAPAGPVAHPALGRTLLPEEFPSLAPDGTESGSSSSPPGPPLGRPGAAGGPAPAAPTDPRVMARPLAGERFIDAVPGFDAPPAVPATPAAPPAVSPTPPSAPAPPDVVPPPAAQAGDDESLMHTVNRRSLAAGAPPPTAPEVQAARCPVGHLSPAHAEVCRICRARMPLPPQPFWAPRPVLGRLVFSNGDVVTLDRGLIVGRAPRIPPTHTGEAPNLVRLNDPTNEVSSQHLEVRLDHWYVLLVDLGSTNGTEVTQLGQPPVRLRPGIPQPIEPGAKVNLADVLSFIFEVTS